MSRSRVSQLIFSKVQRADKVALSLYLLTPTPTEQVIVIVFNLCYLERDDRIRKSLRDLHYFKHSPKSTIWSTLRIF